MTITIDDAQIGRRFTTTVVTELTRTQIVQYAGASGDFNPIHTDEAFATDVAGYPSVFAHGMLTMALTGRALTELVGHGALRSFGAQFRQQVWPGDSLTTEIVVDDVDAAERVVSLTVVTRNQHDAVVLQGTATAALATGRAR